MSIHRPALYRSALYRPGLALLLIVIASLASATADAADPALIEAAKKERQVVWYTTLIVNQLLGFTSVSQSIRFDQRIAG